MKIIFLLLFLICTSSIIGQKVGNKTIKIVLTDTSNIYEKTKHALVNSEFVVKDNGNKDTITTYSTEYDGIHCIGRAIIDGNTILLSGQFGLKRLDDWGYSQNPKKYKPIIYYKGSKGWKLLMQVANRIGGQLTFLQ